MKRPRLTHTSLRHRVTSSELPGSPGDASVPTVARRNIVRRHAVRRNTALSLHILTAAAVASLACSAAAASDTAVPTGGSTAPVVSIGRIADPGDAPVGARVELVADVVAVRPAARVGAVAASARAARPARVWVSAIPTSIGDVVTNIRNLLIGLLVGVATLFATWGGFKYIFANGEPADIERAKIALRGAALGYAIAVLAPLIFSTLQKALGG